ncbi:MAG: hypothetical protein JXQ23_11605 [Clostridia bacterium]|nr:hypothetical protein [Clostridia bacterium]
MALLFSDIHAHVYKYKYPSKDGKMLFINMEELIRTHDALGINKAVLLPIVSPEIYVPQSVGEIIDFANESNGRFIPFCNVDPRVLTNTSDAPIGNLLDYYRNLGCKGIGEVMPNLPWSDLRLQNLLYHVEQSCFPMIFDMTGKKNTGYGIYDDASLPMLEACLAKFKNLIFIGHGPAFWSEISALKNKEDRTGYPDYEVFNEGRMVMLMRAYPNLYCDLSANSGYNALNRDKEYAVKFLNEFQDRILFGTDICYEGQFFNTMNLLLEFNRQNKISNLVLKKLAFSNFDRLIK